MQIHNLQQGSPEWHQHRVKCFNASDVPAMLGISQYKTRTQLLEEYATGIVQEFDEATLRRFADGHRFEALARPIAEEIIGEDLYPIIATEDYGLSRLLSASSDGLTMAYDKNFEHKSLNNDLREVFDNELPLSELYTSQMEQQHMVLGCDETLFMASKFNDNDELVEKRERTYRSDSAMRDRIIAGWKQFEIDLANYVPRVISEKPKAEIVIELPALFVHAKGEITTHNMKEFGEALKAKLEEVRAIALVTDQDFSNAKAAAKMFRDKAKEIKVSKDSMLSQTVTIGEAARMMDAWSKDLNETALQLEKDVEKEDLAKKRLMVSEAGLAYSAHIEALEAETRPIQLNVQRPDFATAIKGKRNYASMQGAVDDALANGKIAADAAAKDIRAKLAWCKETSAGYGFLFNDLAQIIGKPMDDFQLVVTSRIDAYKAAEAAKLEAEREAMRIEEEAKAKAKVEAEAAAARAKLEAETKAQAEAQATLVADQPVSESDVATQPVKDAARPAVVWPFPMKDVSTPEKKATIAQPKEVRPTREQIITAVATAFDTNDSVAQLWLNEEFAGVAA
jgi:putative phage-type endonuclease